MWWARPSGMLAPSRKNPYGAAIPSTNLASSCAGATVASLASRAASAATPTLSGEFTSTACRSRRDPLAGVNVRAIAVVSALCGTIQASCENTTISASPSSPSEAGERVPERRAVAEPCGERERAGLGPGAADPAAVAQRDEDRRVRGDHHADHRDRQRLRERHQREPDEDCRGRDHPVAELPQPARDPRIRTTPLQDHLGREGSDHRGESCEIQGRLLLDGGPAEQIVRAASTDVQRRAARIDHANPYPRRASGACHWRVTSKPPSTTSSAPLSERASSERASSESRNARHSSGVKRQSSGHAGQGRQLPGHRQPARRRRAGDAAAWVGALPAGGVV